MGEGTPSKEFHKRIAIETNEAVWTVLDGAAPELEDLDRALGWAFTSRYHWEEAGTVVNIARAEYMISRVYSAMGQGDLALNHAERCLDLIQSKSEIAIVRADKSLMCREPVAFADFDIVFAYEALARAYSALGRAEECQAYVALARKALDDVSDPNNREVCRTELDKVRCP